MCRYDAVMSRGPVVALDAHASYACRHSGACCTAGWSIPVEPPIRHLVGARWLLPGPGGKCPQFDASSRLCRLHRDYGESMLPGSCHHFPRRALIDQRGTFVNLSHFCPTAAALVVDARSPLRIVHDPPAFPAERGYEGLDARDEWPPLLRPDVLFDFDSFSRWEQFLVEDISGSADPVDTTLARVAATAEELRAWSVERGALLDWTTGVLKRQGCAPGSAARMYEQFLTPAAFLQVAATVPGGLDSPGLPADLAAADAALVEPVWATWTPAVLRYLGARAFASWTAYQSRGVRTQVAELFVAAGVLRTECVRACHRRGSMLDRSTLLEAVRAADLLLVHLVDREALMRWLGKVETDVPAFVPH
jgi:hypothetical protein